MGTSGTQLHMFYVANKSRESETGAYYSLYAFVCHFIFQSATNNTISSNILQYAIYQYSLLAILYCIAVMNIKLQYSNILIYCFTPSVYPIRVLHFNFVLMSHCGYPSDFIWPCDSLQESHPQAHH